MLSGFSPNLTTLLVLRALFGIAMGGEWGVGAALTMETMPPKSRGIVSGLLQTGYPSGYLLASIVFGVFYQSSAGAACSSSACCPRCSCCTFGRTCSESPAFKTLEKKARPGLLATLKQNVGCRSMRSC